jgi:hypothetical protein
MGEERARANQAAAEKQSVTTKQSAQEPKAAAGKTESALELKSGKRNADDGNVVAPGTSISLNLTVSVGPNGAVQVHSASLPPEIKG